MKYRSVKESLARITGKPVERIHIVGGGCRNQIIEPIHRRRDELPGSGGSG